MSQMVLMEIEALEVDDWLDESEKHASCRKCNPGGIGSLAVALCGTMMRVRIKANRPQEGTCEKCVELFYKPCARCGD